MLFSDQSAASCLANVRFVLPRAQLSLPGRGFAGVFGLKTPPKGLKPTENRDSGAIWAHVGPRSRPGPVSRQPEKSPVWPKRGPDTPAASPECATSYDIFSVLPRVTPTASPLARQKASAAAVGACALRNGCSAQAELDLASDEPCGVPARRVVLGEGGIKSLGAISRRPRAPLA